MQRAYGIDFCIRGLHNILYGPTFLIGDFNKNDFKDDDGKKEIVTEVKTNNKLLKKIQGIEAQLSNEKFINNAPKEVVRKKKLELEELKGEL